MSKPKVSIFMPVYNADKYLRESIESILNQSYTNFEFIIIDDGSTDNSINIIESYKDNRIKFFKNEKNMGLPFTRNRGISLCKGTYIALMDADDIALHNRIKKQVTFLENNNEYSIVCSNIIKFNENKKKRQLFKLNEYNEVSYGLCFGNTIPNPTAMFEREFILKNNINYRTDCFIAQDYAFWVDCTNFSKIAKINLPLLMYREGHENITKKSTLKNPIQRKEIIDNIRERALLNQGVILSNNEIILYNKVFSDPILAIDKNDLFKVRVVLDKVIEQFAHEKDEKKRFIYEVKKNYLLRMINTKYNIHEMFGLLKWCIKDVSIKIKLEFIFRIIYSRLKRYC